jgi:hypothetical protein
MFALLYVSIILCNERSYEWPIPHSRSPTRCLKDAVSEVNFELVQPQGLIRKAE